MSQKSSLMKTPQFVPWALTSDTLDSALHFEIHRRCVSSPHVNPCVS